VTYYTTMAGAKAACYSLGELDAGDVNCLQDLHGSFK
jgi:carbamoyl-phosphate synthase large subunit